MRSIEVFIGDLCRPRTVIRSWSSEAIARRALRYLGCAFLLAVIAVPAQGQGRAEEGFPRGHYTPFGYLDNPYHTLWLNNAGVIRTAPPLGFRFRQHDAVLQLAVEVAGKSYAYPEDFAGSNLHAPYHSKNIFTYRWQIDHLVFEATYFLASDSAHALNCELTVRNAGDRAVPVRARIVLSLPTLDLDHYTAHVRDDRIQIQQFAAGPIHLMMVEGGEPYMGVTDSRQALDAFNSEGSRDGLAPSAVSAHGAFAGAAAEISARIEPEETSVFRWVVSRDVSLQAASHRAETALLQFDERRSDLVRSDDDFWRRVPRLTGDWPETWKRGLVYDWETLRMNVRRPIGIYNHPWDGMQVMIPRSVLAETAIDMLAYSYAQPEIAKEVMYGIFADAIASNVPCIREDGSVNMVSETGEESGTAPSWCLPSLTLRSLYSRTADDGWRADLLPFLESFIAWWMEHRTHDNGAYFFDNSWESGQDVSSRFLIDHRTGGMSVRHMEPVELHAAMADFAALLADWTRDESIDPERDWEALFSEMRQRTQNHWVDGRFRDFDRRTDEFTDVLIAYHLTPFVFGLADSTQKSWLHDFAEDEIGGELFKWTHGAPSIQVMLEALWNVGARDVQAELIDRTLNHVYAQWDRRDWQTPHALPRVWGHVDRPAARLEYHPRTWAPQTGNIDRSTNPGSAHRPSFVPMPGVASEFWRDDNGLPNGMENYGWGATLPMHLIRGIIGYREPSDGSNGFLLAPSIPENLMVTGATYAMENLHYRDIDFDVAYHVLDGEQLEVHLTWRSDVPVHIGVSGKAAVLAESPTAVREGKVSYRLDNHGVSRVDASAER